MASKLKRFGLAGLLRMVDTQRKDGSLAGSFDLYAVDWPQTASCFIDASLAAKEVNYGDNQSVL
jgi:hypothetical protein